MICRDADHGFLLFMGRMQKKIAFFLVRVRAQNLNYHQNDVYYLLKMKTELLPEGKIP